MSPAALPAKEAARYIGVSPSTLERLAEKGELFPLRITTVRDGDYGKRVWRVRDLDAYLDRLAREQLPQFQRA